MDGLPVDLTARTSDALRQSGVAKAELVQRAAERGEGAKAAKMFEELLATVMVREMRRSLDEGFFGKGAGSDVFEGWLDENVGRALSDTHALDLAQSIRTSLGSKAREGATEEGK